MYEDERAPLYLLKLHQELDELGPYPRSAIPAAIILTLGLVYVGTGLLGLFRNGILGSLPWFYFGSGVTFVGFLLARHAYRWFRQARSLKRGINLIESRQAAGQGPFSESPETEGPESEWGLLNGPGRSSESGEHHLG